MKENFDTMNSSSLCEYVKSWDFQLDRDLRVDDFNWCYIKDYQLNSLNILSMESNKDWIKWIDNEQSMFLEDAEYDRYKEVEEYWIPNPYEEPVILVQYSDGTNDISDGWHRTGLSFRNNLKAIPVILGIEKNNL